MKTVVKGVIRNEKGYLLITVLILLIVGGLILTPLLGLMSTGLLAGKVYEKKMDEYYAADAGVEDAIWKIMHSENISYPYYYPEPLTVNGKSVDVVINRTDIDQTPCEEDFTYHILSTAVTDDGGGTAAIGSSTTIDAHIATTVTYSSILDYLVAIQENLDIDEIDALELDLKNLGILDTCPTTCIECDKCGHAYSYGSDEYESVPRGCYGCIAVYNFPGAGWPTVSDLSGRYLKDVENAESYSDTSIDLRGNSCPPGPIYIDEQQNNNWPSGLGPLYVDGELTVENKDQNTATLSLNGTLYITGHTEIGMNGAGGKPNLSIELNGQTIFVACNYTKSNNYAFKIGDWCTINGPGAIVAVGDIYLKPNGTLGPNQEPVLVISVSGTTTIQPSVDFLGTIAGKDDVNLGSGHASVEYPMGGFGPINFPTLFQVELTYSIASWEINPL